MHRTFPHALFTTLFLASLSVLFIGCAPTQTSMDVESTTLQDNQNTNQAETHAFDQEQSITSAENPITNEINDPWLLVESSIGKSTAESNVLLLRASELFLDRQHYSTAYTMLEEIDPSWLDSNQKQFFALIRARYTLLTGSTSRAQSLLAQIPLNNAMSSENYARFLQMDIAIATQQLDFRRVVLARINLDPLLFGQAQLINQRRIFNTLTRESQLFPISDNTTSNPVLEGWLALAELNRINQLNDIEIAAWEQHYPQHPAQTRTLATTQTNSRISSNQIALLLPTTSKLGRAAEAFKAGFDAASSKDGRYDHSRVYDIGSETELIGLYYQSAINDGADFIIGPLGRAGVQTMLTHLSGITNPGVSTLLLGELGAEHASIPNLWGLSLSPEQDAAAIAERAISQGMHRALILQKNNDWGTRLGGAFTTAYTAKGGTVVGNQRFQPTGDDHTYEIKKLLKIGSSERRHQQLQNLLGTKLEFSVRRRNDIDFIFLAGNTLDARRIIPLVKFYRAHDLPVYASSSAYNGKFNKLTDEDLKGLQFADLPWLLSKQLETQAREAAKIKAQQDAAKNQLQVSTEGLSTAPPKIPGTEKTSGNNDALPEETPFEKLPYSSATLNRLYALGYTAFEAIPQLSYLQSDEWYHLDTETMSLTMDQFRNLRHSVTWGKYVADGITITP